MLESPRAGVNHGLSEKFGFLRFCLPFGSDGKESKVTPQIIPISGKRDAAAISEISRRFFLLFHKSIIISREMTSTELAETVALLGTLVKEHGAEKAGKILECLTDVHSTLIRYDDDVRTAALSFVLREASK